MDEEAVQLKRLGNRAIAQRDYKGARAAFEGLIQREPNSPEGYVGLAKVYHRTQQDRAVVELIQPVILRLRTAPMLKALADAYRVLANQGDTSAVRPAIRYYEELRHVRPDPVSLFYLGELYREHERDFTRALETLCASWELDPRSPTVYAAALDCAKKLGDAAAISRVKGMKTGTSESDSR